MATVDFEHMNFPVSQCMCSRSLFLDSPFPTYTFFLSDFIQSHDFKYYIYADNSRSYISYYRPLSQTLEHYDPTFTWWLYTSMSESDFFSHVHYLSSVTLWYTSIITLGSAVASKLTYLHLPFSAWLLPVARVRLIMIMHVIMSSSAKNCTNGTSIYSESGRTLTLVLYNLLPITSVNSFPFPAPEPLIHSASATEFFVFLCSPEHPCWARGRLVLTDTKTSEHS